MIAEKPHTRLAPTLPSHLQRYHTWLHQLESQPSSEKDRATYRAIAEPPTLLHKTQARLFAPYQDALSAHRTLTRTQFYGLLIFLAIALASASFLRLEAATIALGCITALYITQLIITAFVVIRELARDESGGIDDSTIKALRDEPWPMYTVLCPLYQEAAIVPQFVRAMSQLDYPAERLEVLLLTEEEDSETRIAIEALQPLPSSFRLMTVPTGQPRTKPRACNYGLLHARGRYVVIYDAEDIPEPTQLKKAVLAFADGDTKLACVQARLNFYNVGQNLLTRLFSIEYSTWFDLMLPALARSGFALPLGGTSNHFQASCLRALGGWDAFNVTEDADLGMRLAQYGFKTAMLASVTYEEANSSPGNWIRQRSRWMKGFMQTYLVNVRNPLKSLKRGRSGTLISLQLAIGNGALLAFINPLMWLGLLVYIAFRSHVETVYHVLFPTPVLYLGMICLIFGNFFSIYTSMLACARKERYSLVPWCLLLPFYWLLMSAAGMKALWQLITRPHYWEKTRHGLHLGKGQQIDVRAVVGAATRSIEHEDTVRLLAVQSVLTTTTERIRAMPTLLMPAVKGKAIVARKRDTWAWVTGLVAGVCSIAATIYYYNAHEILLYGDAHSHMRIARSVFDSATPGIAQLGTVWLPLPHILMWPFIWNDFLWHSGLAGSIPSMCCFIISSVLIYLIIKRYSKNGALSFAGSLLFILNPNALYLQTTPLSELTCIVTFLAAGYAFLRWIDKETSVALALTAFLAFLATLARYDGWAMFAALFVLVIGVEIIRKRPWKRIVGHALIFGLLGGLGIALWFIWNAMLFGNPRYFQEGPFSAQAQQQSFFKIGTLYSYHNLWTSIRDYVLTSVSVVGLLPLALTACIVLLYLIRTRRSLLELGMLIFFIPFAFYIVSLYTGQGVIQFPGIMPPGKPYTLFNVRYGIQMLAPCTIFLSIGISWLPFKKWFVGYATLIALALFQLVSITSSGVITLQEGILNICQNPQQQTNVYLAEHYNSGYILQDAFTSAGFDASVSGIDFHHVIYQGSGSLWKQALVNPASVVEWVSFDPHDTLDQVGTSSGVHNAAFLRDFELVLEQPNGRVLYHRRGLAPLPNRPLPADSAAPYQLCTGKEPWTK